MKKLILFLCVTMFSVVTFAQQGESAVGINLNVTPSIQKEVSLTNLGISAKYQYGITNSFRAEGIVGYDFKAKGVSLFEIGANIHYLFNLSNKLNVYPIVGLGYANIKGAVTIDDDDFEDYNYRYDEDEYDIEISSSVNKLYVNVGVGMEYGITNNINLNFEVKYQYIKDFSRLPISLGITYKF